MNDCGRAYKTSVDDVEAEVPATHAQRRFWHLQDISGTSLALPLAMELRGPFNLPALQAAVDEALRTHDVLRTSFVLRSGTLLQSVGARVQFVPYTVDLSTLGRLQARTAADDLLEYIGRRRIDMSVPPLLYGVILRLAGDTNIVVFAIHHVVVDERSMQVLVETIAQSYTALSDGRPLPRRSTSTSFRQVAQAIGESREESTFRQAIAFWRDYLQGAPSHLSPAPDRDHGSRRAFSARRVTRRCASGLLRRVVQATQRLRATRFCIAATSLVLVIARLCDHRDVVIALNTTLRRGRDMQHVLGPFMNTFVLRVALYDVRTFAEAVSATMRSLGKAFAHSDVPFDHLYQALKPVSGATVMPFAQVNLSDRASASLPRNLGPLQIYPIESAVHVTSFDLAFSIAWDGDDVVMSCSYADTLYEAATVSSFLETWERILEEGLSAPDKVIDSIGADCVSPHHDALTAKSFAAQLLGTAQQRPTAIALCCAASGTTLTYDQLIRKTRAMARGLLIAGVKPGEAVGICLPRGVDHWIACIAVLLTGAAFVPLRYRDPREVLVAQIKHCGMTILIGDDLTLQVVNGSGTRGVTADFLEDCGFDALESVEEEPCGEAVAYIIYTSGSTGSPKGVEVPHRALNAVLSAFCSDEYFNSSTSMLSITDPSFDIAALEVLGPLSVGGRAIIAPEGAAADGELIAKLLHSTRSTALQATPFSWSLLLESGWRGDRSFLAMCGGEQAHTKLTDLLSAMPGVTLNVYGPTETTIWSTRGRMVSGPRGAPIGRSLPGESVYVLDSWLAATPPGGVGQLFIGGVGLAHGYREDPIKTAECFIPDPYSAVPGSRMFRTADRVRRRVDDEIEFRGRLDDQVKIRGFRVDLDGVATILATHPAIRECMVARRDDDARGPYLAAYFTTSRDPNTVAQELRTFARSRLPAYCVPGAFVPLDALPVTPTNKHDRRALPKPSECEFALPDGALRPETATQMRVAAVWKSVLGDVECGVDTDFFSLGAGSLDAVQVATRIRLELCALFTFARMLDHPTVREIAAFVDANNGVDVKALSFVEVYEARTLVSPQIFAWLDRELRFGDSSSYNVRFQVRIRGRFDAHALHFAMAQLTARHEALRLRFELDDDGRIFMHADAAWLTHCDIRHIQMSGCDVRLVADAVKQFQARPFEFNRSPLVRVGVFRLTEQDHVLVMAAAHVVFDRWSLQVFGAELAQLYSDAASGTQSFESPPLQFSDFVRWQREWQWSAASGDDLRYWLRKMLPLPALLFEPIASARTLTKRLTHTFDQNATKHLTEVARRNACTPFACVLKWVLWSLHRITEKDDICVIILAGNRDEPMFKSTIGFLMNPTIIRVSASRLREEEGINQVWDELRNTHRHQKLPFELVARALGECGLSDKRVLGQTLVMWNDVIRTRYDLNSAQTEPFRGGEDAPFTEATDDMPLVFDFWQENRELHLVLTHRLDFVSEVVGNQLLKTLADGLNPGSAAS